jgi:6-phosphogluconolactonase
VGERLIFDDLDVLAASAAERVAAAARARLGERGRFALGLSGGRTPGRLYRRLASPPLRDSVDWNRVRIFFADERAVPPTDPESNFRMARETLIDPAGIAPTHVHRMKGEYPDLEAAAVEYEAHLTEPLDLLILGVGEDGHTASLFPGSPLARERSRRVAVVRDSPKPPPARLTITPRVIAEAREIIVLATGVEKADAVARALADSADPLDVPASLAQGGCWHLDRPAASRIAV